MPHSPPFASVSREIGGRPWQTDAELPPAVAALCATDLRRAHEQPGVILIRNKRLRRTMLVPCGEGLALIKEMKPPAGLTRLVWHVRPHSGRREWAWACRFAKAGLRVPQPWAYFHGGTRTSSWFIQEGLPDVLDLVTYHQRYAGGPAGDPALGRALGEHLGRLLAQVHATGANHPDLHPGNILCRGTDAASVEVYLVDYHSVRRGVGPRKRYQAANLAGLFRHIEPLLGREHARLVLDTYLARAPHPAWPSVEALEAELAARIPRLAQRRARSRARKAFVDSSGFRVQRSANGRVWSSRSVDPAEVATIVERANTGRVTVHKHRPGSAVAHTTLQDGRRVWIKTYSHTGVWKQLEAYARRTYGRRGWYAMERGWHLLCPVVCAVAYVEEWDGWRLVRSHLITHHAPHRVDLDTLLFSGSHCHGDPQRLRRKREIIRTVARMVRHLHEQGVYHRDLSAKNILVEPMAGWWQLWLVDVESIRFPPFGVPRRARLRNLAQLTGLPCTITLRDQIRFYREYCGDSAAMRAAMVEVPTILALGAKTQRRWRIRQDDAMANDLPGPHAPGASLLDTTPALETPPPATSDRAEPAPS